MHEENKCNKDIVA